MRGKLELGNGIQGQGTCFWAPMVHITLSVKSFSKVNSVAINGMSILSLLFLSSLFLTQLHSKTSNEPIPFLTGGSILP